MIALSERIGTVTRGATDMEISRLPEQVFASPSSSSSSADQEKLTCAICMGEFQVNDVLLLMPGCLHRFHKPCIETWLKQSRKCPVSAPRVPLHILYHILIRCVVWMFLIV